MPAGLPGSSVAQNNANPSAGAFVIFDPLSGPKGSPFDKAGTIHASTGGLCTGIGFSAQNVISLLPVNGPTAPYSIEQAGFNDNGVPGEVFTFAAPPPPGVVSTNTVNSTRMYIGGGKCTATVQGIAPVVPYTAGIAICGAGNGGSRDGGAGPTVFTGFPLKMVTAVGSVTNGVDIEAGFKNRSGVTMVSGQSAHGSSDANLAAAS